MKQRILQLVILFLFLTPVLASAASPTVSPSDRLEDQATLDLHVTWNGIPVAAAPVYLYSETGTYLDRLAKTDARGHVQVAVPTTPHNFKVEYRGKEYWTGNLFAIAGQKLEVEAPLERLADITTNNPTAARYDGEPPIYNYEPVRVASIGTYIGILSQASVAQVQPQSKVYYFITDQLGTPMKMTDESGAVVWSADHRPFGELSVSNATVENKFRFPGQYYDPETAQHYNYHRYYQPKSGRYLTPDPIGLAGGINLYAYVANNPVNLIDPEGEAAFWYHFYDGFRAGLAMERGFTDSLRLGWATMMPDFNQFKTLPEAHATSASRRITKNEAMDNSLNMACEEWKSNTMEGQATAIHIWRDVVSHGGSYFPEPASTWDYVEHIVRYDLLPGGSFDSVIGARIRSLKP